MWGCVLVDLNVAVKTVQSNTKMQCNAMNMASPGSHKSPHITPSASALTVSADNIRLKMMENYCADRVSPSCDDGNPAFLIDIDLFRAVPSVPSITRGQHFTFVVCVSPDFASKLLFHLSSSLNISVPHTTLPPPRRNGSRF